MRLPSHYRSLSALDKALVVAHQQLRFDGLHGLDRHADDNQQRGAADQRDRWNPVIYGTMYCATAISARKMAPASVMREITRSR